MPDLFNTPGFTPRLLTGSCIAGPVLGLMLYAVLRIFGAWHYTPLVFAAVLLLGIGSFIVWAWYFGEG